MSCSKNILLGDNKIIKLSRSKHLLHLNITWMLLVSIRRGLRPLRTSLLLIYRDRCTGIKNMHVCCGKSN